MEGSASFNASFKADAEGEVVLNWIKVNATVWPLFH